MQTRSFCALAVVTMAASAAANSFRDDSHYVTLGPRTGYYIVRPASVFIQQLGIQGAPTRDTADVSNPGRRREGCLLRFDSPWGLSAGPRPVDFGPHQRFSRRCPTGF